MIATLMAFQTAKTQCLLWAGQFGGPATGRCNAIEVDGSGTVYPNPASTHITIETSSQGQVSIINLQGKELMSQ